MTDTSEHVHFISHTLDRDLHQQDEVTRNGLPSAEFTTCSQRSTQRHHISRFATEDTRARLAGMSLLERRSVGTATQTVRIKKSLLPLYGATVS